MNTRVKITILILTFALLMPTTAYLDDERKQAYDQAAAAAEVLHQIMEAPEQGIPLEILDRAEAIAVFPTVYNVGFSFGGRGNNGLVSVRDPIHRHWMPPVFVKLESKGWRESRDLLKKRTGQVQTLVLIGLTRYARDLFLSEEFKLDSVSPGLVGEFTPDGWVAMKSPIIAYARVKGQFNGTVMTDTVIKLDDDLNEEIYDDDDVGDFIFVSERALPSGIAVFTETLSQYTRKNSGT